MSETFLTLGPVLDTGLHSTPQAKRITSGTLVGWLLGFHRSPEEGEAILLKA